MNKKLLLIIALSLIGSVLVFIMTGRESRRQPVAVGLTAPEYHVLDVASGERLAPDRYKGKTVFVNFWASWCQPCKDEMPSLEALYRELSENGSFRMITILYKDDPRNALEYMKAKGYTFPVYIDYEGTSARNFGVTGVPETYIVDKDGILKHRIIGPADWMAPEARNAVISLL